MIFFDTADRLAHGNARRMPSLDALLAEADVVSLHVDGRPGQRRASSATSEFAKMKPRALFINAARGMVVDDVALRRHIESGHIAGAALDVFPVEPKAQGDEFQSVLRGLDNVILTPHVGGSTQEAQEEIGWFVAGKLAAFVGQGSTALSVNLPAVQPPALVEGARIAYLHVNVPGVLAEVNAYLAEQGANVVGQYLATRGEQGYVVTDATEAISEAALDKLRSSAAHHLAAHLRRLSRQDARARCAARPRLRPARQRRASTRASAPRTAGRRREPPGPGRRRGPRAMQSRFQSPAATAQMAPSEDGARRPRRPGRRTARKQGQRADRRPRVRRSRRRGPVAKPRAPASRQAGRRARHRAPETHRDHQGGTGDPDRRRCRRAAPGRARRRRRPRRSTTTRMPGLAPAAVAAAGGRAGLDSSAQHERRC